MNKYIDSEAFSKAINALMYRYTTGYLDASTYNEAISDAADVLVHFPPADVQEVRHGYWINDNGLYKCSVCNTFTITGWATCIPIDQMNKTMQYCNNCGAKMDLEGERK